MMRTFKFQTFIMLLLLVLVTGCVGTVEKGAPDTTEFTDPKKVAFEFKGIVDYRAVSHTRIELEFFPTFGTDDYEYFLHPNGKDGVKLNMEDLDQSIGGLLSYTVRDLSINSIYKYRISAKEIDTGYVSMGENEVIINTFPNWTADFEGIQDVELVPGQSDSVVTISWYNPQFIGTLDAQSTDPVYYILAIAKEEDAKALKKEGSQPEVTYRRIPSNKSQFLDVGSPPSQTRIYGLEQDTTYVFRLRAVHKSWYTEYLANGGNNEIPVDDNLIPTKRDYNTRMFRIKTDDALDPATFVKSSLQVSAPDGIAAYSSVNAAWFQAQGLFKGYRLFYKELVPDDPADSVADQLTQVQTKDLLDDQFFTDFDDNSWNCENKLATEGWGCIEIDSDVTSYNITGLNKFKFYQVRIAVCLDDDCTIKPGEVGAAIISEFDYGRTEAILAPFGGIDFIKHPQDPSEVDPLTVNIVFDPPALSKGHADTMSLWCIDPDDYDNGSSNPSMVRFPDGLGQPIIASNVANCDNLRYLAANGQLDTDTTKLKIYGDTPPNGMKDITAGYAQSRYCFALVPSIENESELKTLPYDNWVVRCINPEVQVPTIEEFAGLNPGCTVNENDVNLNWVSPSGGIYSHYRVMWLKKDGGETLDYNAALNIGVDSVESSGTLFMEGLYVVESAKNDAFKYEITELFESKFPTGLENPSTQITIEDMMPGNTYTFAILAGVDKGGGNILYSEFNTGMVDCYVPLPKVRFNEWTRIFAVGPKTNGLVPKRNPYHMYREEAYLYEAVNRDGIPYEMLMDEATSLPETDDAATGYQYFVPPGNYDDIDPTLDPANFDMKNTIVDGRPDENLFYASKKGIISLAWKEVVTPDDVAGTATIPGIEFMGDLFISRMDTEDALNGNDRSKRKWGYKIYRSNDNRKTWVNVTDISGLLHSKDYSYYEGQPSNTTNSRMLFFTDYSVKAQDSADKYEYARTYWYKIIPVFDGKELPFYSADKNGVYDHNTIRVTLPPANMALVHRMMANRRSCMEMSTAGGGFEYINSGTKLPNAHYNCDFNGVGSKRDPVSKLLAIDSTHIDQGGDILMDRFELGCNITRGHLTNSILTSKSLFHKDIDTRTYGNKTLESHLSEFKGNSHTGILEGNAFMGCVAPDRIDSGNFLVSNNGWYSHITDGSKVNGDSYNKVIWGDCVSRAEGGLQSWTSSTCDPTRESPYTYYAPGLWNIWDTSTADIAICTDTDDDQRPDLTSLLFSPKNQREYTLQAEQFAVLYERAPTSGYRVQPTGPGDSSIWKYTSGTSRESCFINLASIGSKDGSADPDTAQEWWRSRWIGTSNNKTDVSGQQLVLEAANQGKKFAEMTVSEVGSDSKLYDNISYRYPHGSFSDPVLPIDGHPDGLPGRVRYEADTPMGFIYSSNSARLPQMKDMRINDAQTLCNLREVKVGYSDGSNFNTEGAPMKKRLPRRIELIAASAWPDNIETSSDNDDKSFSETEITNTEKGDAASNSGDACTGPTSAAVGRSPGLANRYTSNAFMLSTAVGHLASGSSHVFDTNFGEHSQECISQYGIQDIVGNLRELSSEALVCDYSVDEIYYGPYTGNPTNNSGSPNLPLSIDLTKDIGGGGVADTRFWQSNATFTPQYSAAGTVYDGCLDTTTNLLNEQISEKDCGSDFQGILTGHSGTYPPYIVKDAPIYWLDSNGDVIAESKADNKVYAIPDINSGFCSIVDRDSYMYKQTSRFRDLSSDIFFPTKLFSGALNTAVVPFSNPFGDQGSFEQYRDGDGFFMNFGPRHQFVGLSKNNSNAISNAGLLSPTTDEAVGKFFNPIVGFPLSCGSETPIGGGGCGTSADNKLFNMTKEADGTITQDFFVGNSNIFNKGLSYIGWNVEPGSTPETDGFWSLDIVTTGDPTTRVTFQNDVIDKFFVDENGKITPNVVKVGDAFHDPNHADQATYGPLDLPDPAHVLEGNQMFMSAQFSIPRGDRLHITTGGSAYLDSLNQAEPSGRYTASIDTHWRSMYNSGIRCVVRINEE